MSLHKQNSFITLTYDDEHLESDFIAKEDFQNFMKKLRLKVPNKIRYMASFEYGTKNYRPHIHFILFGFNPPNQKYVTSSSKGSKLYTSKFIEELWGKGFHSIGEATGASANYIAKYADKGKNEKEIVDSNGEVHVVKDSMTVSVRPGIGHDYFLKNAQQLVDSKKPLPKYYINKLDEWGLDEKQKFTYEQRCHFRDLAEIYEGNLTSNKIIDPREKYAKFIINNHQSANGHSHYRETLQQGFESERHDRRERELKRERDGQSHRERIRRLRRDRQLSDTELTEDEKREKYRY